MSTSTNLGLTLPANGDDVGTWDVPVNGNFTILDTARSSVVINAGAASGTVALTSSQYTRYTLYISGAPAGDVTYQLPLNIQGFWVLKDVTTGGHTIRISSAGGGSTVTLTNGINTPIACDVNGNVYLQSTIAATPAGSNTQVQYNNSGALGGSSGLTYNNGTSALTVGGPLSVGGTFSVSGNVTSSLNIAANAQTPEVAVTFSATAMSVNCDASNVFGVTMTANVTTAPTMTTPNNGQTINWFITQDGTGHRTMTWPSSFKWPGGTAGVLSTAANAVDLLVATYRSTTGNWYATLTKAFS